MYHLLANYVSIGQTDPTALAPVADQVVSVQNAQWLLPQDQRLLAALALSTTLSRAQIVSPTLRQIANPYIRPINRTAVPATNANVMMLDRLQMVLKGLENTYVQATSALAMGNEDCSALLWIGDGVTPVPMGNVYPLRWTSTTAAVAHAWTDATVTFTDVIPNGQYVAVDTEHYSTTGVGHRWIFSNQVPRPGSLSLATIGLRKPIEMEFGRLGQMGQFKSIDLPRAQVYCNSTDNSHEGYLWVIRTGSI